MSEMLSERTLHWFGEKSRADLLAEIDRLITTDRPAIARLYETLREARDCIERLGEYDRNHDGFAAERPVDETQCRLCRTLARLRDTCGA